MTTRLQGKRVVITGAASGIGCATARRFIDEGASVALLDRDRDGVTDLADDLGADARAFVVDVSDEAAVAAAIHNVATHFAGIDTVVANAGVQLFGRDAAAADLALETWEYTLAVNLTGVFLVCKYAIPALLDSPGSSIICTASPTGIRGLAPGFDAYSTSKAGVAGLVRVMAADYGPRGLRVNAVVPGFTDTPLVHPVMNHPVDRELLVNAIPLRRPGSPEEVASAMVFLASDEASYITGILLPVDGGITAV